MSNPGSTAQTDPRIRTTILPQASPALFIITAHLVASGRLDRDCLAITDEMLAALDCFFQVEGGLRATGHATKLGEPRLAVGQAAPMPGPSPNNKPRRRMADGA